ncbi:MAG: hypothetical protein ABR512_01280 [Desulfopila sp.]
MKKQPNDTGGKSPPGKRVLLVYYSFSGQTRRLIQAFGAGLEDSGVEVTRHRLIPLERLSFPLGSFFLTLKMMVSTFFRRPIAITPESEKITGKWDLIVLAGPTWSYNPSGPVLRFYESNKKVFDQQRVLPFISCRGYWRMHYWQLRWMLQRCGAMVQEPVIFKHHGSEPWRSIGVFCKIAGRNPESYGWLSRYYKRYGHSKEQVRHSGKLGMRIGAKLRGNDACKSRNRSAKT